MDNSVTLCVKLLEM